VIQHNVLMKVKPGTTDEQLEATFEAGADLPGQIPGLQKLTYGPTARSRRTASASRRSCSSRTRRRSRPTSTTRSAPNTCGFEGLGSAHVLPDSAHLPVLEEEYVRERLFHRKASPVGGSEPCVPDDHDLLSRIEILLDAKLAVPSKFQVALDHFPDSSFAHISVSVGKVGGLEYLYIGMPQVLGGIGNALSVKSFVVLTGQLHVLLRHRRRSISLPEEGALP
jgi:hypothetical protein